MRSFAAGMSVLAAALAATCGAASGAMVETGPSGWAWGSPAPQGNQLVAIDFAGGGRGYAAGAFGTVLRTDDGGGSWTGLPSGRLTPFTRLAVLGPDAIVVGGGCVLRRSDDAGRSFRRLPFTVGESRCAAPLAGVAFSGAQDGTLLLADGTVLRTSDGGRSFARRTPVPGTPAAGGGFDPADVVALAPDTALAAAGDRIARTVDGGRTWALVHEAGVPVRALHVASARVAYAVGGEGRLLRSEDAGATWAARPLAGAGAVGALSWIRCAGEDVCLMAGARGDALLRTADGGATAVALTAADQPLRAVAFADPSRAVAVGDRGATAVSADGGRTFARSGGELPDRYTRLRAAGDLAVVAGLRGALARSTDGGQTWSASSVSTTEDLVDVALPTAASGYALDARGTLLRTDNEGASWRILGAVGGSAVLALGTETVLVAGRGVRRSTNGGETFDATTGPGVRGATLGELDRGGSAVAAYGRRSMFVSTNGGRRFRRVRLPSKRTIVAAADLVSSRRVFLLDDNGRLWRTTNGGRRWSEVLGVGSSPLAGVSFSSARTGWTVLDSFRGERNGWVLRTQDGGATWRPQLVSPTPLAGGSILGTPTLVATGSARAVAVSPGTEDADDDYGGGTALSGPQSLFATVRGGDRGRDARLTLTGPRSRARRGANVRLRGRLRPAAGGESVLVSLRSAGSTTWRSVVARTASDGTFEVRRRLGRTTFAVAQIAGDGERNGAATRVVTVRVR